MLLITKYCLTTKGRLKNERVILATKNTEVTKKDDQPTEINQDSGKR